MHIYIYVYMCVCTYMGLKGAYRIRGLHILCDLCIYHKGTWSLWKLGIDGGRFSSDVSQKVSVREFSIATVAKVAIRRRPMYVYVYMCI